ncbi:MAG: ParA family protein [Actinobacteria bacterium]|nr:ParA family protein [Actinomycetota bacterium]
MSKHTIAVLNQKGGVGKTTTTINVAAYLAKEGKRVLIVDSDPQGNATSGSGVDKSSLGMTVYDLLTNDKVKPGQVVIPTQIKNISIAPANATLAAAEVDLVQVLEREKRMKNSLDQLDYDVALIDCPPSLGLLTINALTASDSVLIPVQAEYYALEGLGQLLDIIQRVRGGLNANLELLGVVVTMFDSRNSLSDQVKKELENYFGDKLLDAVIPRNVRLAEAPSYGVSIFEHDKWSKGARAYKQLAKEIQKRAKL